MSEHSISDGGIFGLQQKEALVPTVAQQHPAFLNVNQGVEWISRAATGSSSTRGSTASVRSLKEFSDLGGFLQPNEILRKQHGVSSVQEGASERTGRSSAREDQNDWASCCELAKIAFVF